MKSILPLCWFSLNSFAGAYAQTPLTAPGVYAGPDYYLANTITCAVPEGSACITFTGPVRFNLAGQTITSTNGQGIGIYINAPISAVIEGDDGGNIDGFSIGISSSTPWTRVQGVSLRNIKYMGISLGGRYSRAAYNTVTAVGGATREAYAVGINIVGDDGEIIGNLLTDFYRQSEAPPGLVGEGVPIIVNAGAHRVLVERNTLSNTTSQPNTIGIFLGGDSHTVRYNTIYNFKDPIQGGEDAPGVTIFKNTLLNVEGNGHVGISGEFGSATYNVIGGYATQISGAIHRSNNTEFRQASVLSSH